MPTKLARWCRARGLSYSELARRCNATPQTISRVASGARRPSFDIMLSIWEQTERAIGHSILDYLVGEADEKERRGLCAIEASRPERDYTRKARQQTRSSIEILEDSERTLQPQGDRDAGERDG